MPDVQRVLRQFDQAKTRKSNFTNNHQEMAELTWPAVAEFNRQRTKGEKRSQLVYDSTAAQDLERFAAVFESLLIPRAQMYQRIQASDENLNKEHEVKLWMEEATRALFKARRSTVANFHANMHESFKSLGAFGTQNTFVDGTEDGEGIRYKHIYLGQTFFEVDHQRRPAIAYRLFPISPLAAEKKWGKDKLTPTFANKLEQDPYHELDVLHVVRPRQGDFDPEGLGPNSMPWESFYISIEDKQLIGDEGGFHELPYIISRYTLNPSEEYGRGPMDLIFPSVRMLQEMAKTFVRAGQKAVDPPLLVHDDGVLGYSGGQEVGLTPGYVNIGGVNSQGQQLIQPMVTGFNPQLMDVMIDKEREVVHKAFLVDLFQILVESPQMTAFEVAQRMQEKGQLIAPLVGRQETELLGPLTEREINILQRQGNLPPLPEALVEAEGEYKIEYLNPATRLIRGEELVGMMRWKEDLVSMAAFNEEVLDLLDPEAYGRVSGEINGVPTEVIRAPEVLEKLKRARQEAAEEENVLGALPDVAKAAKDFADAGATAQTGAAAVGA